jgi:hypothetical protein
MQLRTQNTEDTTHLIGPIGATQPEATYKINSVYTLGVAVLTLTALSASAIMRKGTS